MFGAWAAIEHVGVDSWANGATFQILDKVSDDCKPLHSLERLLHPEVKLAQVEVVSRVLARVVHPLAVKNGEQAVVFCQFSLDREAQTLCNLIDLHIDGVTAISIYPVWNFLE